MTYLYDYDNKSYNSNIDFISLFEKINCNESQKSFVISKKNDGSILSLYSDDTWDLTPYSHSSVKMSKINFNTLPMKLNIVEEIKKFLYLILVFKSGRNNSSYSPQSLYNLFNSIIKPLAYKAAEKNISIYDLISNSKNLDCFIKSLTINKIKDFLSLSSFINSLDYKVLNFRFNISNESFNFLKNKQAHYKYKQTHVIPSRIYIEIIKQKTEHIKEIYKYIDNLAVFFDKCISDNIFAIKGHKYHHTINNKIIVKWDKAIQNYDLEYLFKKYNVKNKTDFIGFLAKIQNLCKDVIHIFSGMRESEVINMKTNCLNYQNGIYSLKSITPKLTGNSSQTIWITSKEVKYPIVILHKINEIFSKNYNIEINKLPLFIKPSLFKIIKNIDKKEKLNRTSFGKITKNIELDNSKLKIKKEDIEELNDLYIALDNSTDDLNIGDVWNYTSHQFRRSLAIYAVRSGIVSIGALQNQFKHLFRDMTYYYCQGSSFTQNIVGKIDESLSSNIKKYNNDIKVFEYIKNILYSDEPLFNNCGEIINNTSSSVNSLKKCYLKNKNVTVKKFINGDISYQDTALGSCVSSKHCNSRLSRSFLECINCDSSIIKKSNVINCINEIKEYLNFFDRNSIEYTTEIKDLKVLEQMLNKLENRSIS